MKNLICSLAVLGAAASSYAGPILWASTENAYLVAIDAAKGDTFVVGNTTLNGNNLMLNDIAIDVNGDMWGITHTGFYKVDRTTGVLTFIGDHTIQSGAGLGIASDGFTVLGVGSGTNNLCGIDGPFVFSIDTATGASSPICGAGLGTTALGDIASFGSRLFMTSAGHNLVEIDPVNGTPIGAPGVAEFGMTIWAAKGLTAGADGNLYLGSGDSVFMVSTSVGNFGQALSPQVLNIIGGAPVGVDGLGRIRGLASETPEPGTWAMLGCGLAALGLARRRR